MFNCSVKSNSPRLSTPHTKITTLIWSACFLAICTSANAESDDIRVEEGHTASHLMGADVSPEIPRLTTSLNRESENGSAQIDLAPRHILWFSSDFWISDIGTLLYKDADRDGYFSGFSLTIDADTHYSHAEVYAAIDMQLPQGARERLHTTGTFHLYGNSITDEYRIDVELVQNYPIGHYDLFVNLVDAYDHTVLDTVDASEFSNLAGLPLESEDSDHQPETSHPVSPAPTTPPNNTNIRVTEYSGALNYGVLLALMTSIFMRYKRRTRRAQS